MATGPNVSTSHVRAHKGLVRVGFTFPIAGGGEWGWSCTVSPELAKHLADQLREAAKAAREQIQPEEHSASSNDAG